MTSLLGELRGSSRPRGYRFGRRAVATVRAWERRYTWRLLVSDVIAIAAATSLAALVRFGGGNADARVRGISYSFIEFGIGLIWLVLLFASRAYEGRFLGVGSEEFKRVFNACVRLTAGLAVIAYAFRLEIARGYVGVALPLGTLFLLGGRYLNRQALHHARRHGRYLHRVLAIGGVEGIQALVAQARREPYAGFDVVGACLPQQTSQPVRAGVPILGTVDTLAEAIEECRADTVAVTHGPGLAPEALRRLAWQLEGSGVDLVVTPALTDIAGPRISIRPVAGLPLLHVDEPELTGARQLFKSCLERSVAALALVMLAPLLLVAALAVRFTTPGPAFFRQCRVGKGGREFMVFKLRTMRMDAETLLAELADRNEAADGLLFKIRQDPRVTGVGRWLRRYSLDELPQLWNIVRGEMALVGPRPPLPSEVERYDADVRRRLLVKPGITGLWQVSGRSDLSWEDAVRLDLYYVENWSLSLDVLILWKTFFAIVRADGAY